MDDFGSNLTSPTKKSGALRFRLLIYLLLNTKKQHPIFTTHRAECLIGALRWISTEEKIRLLKIATRTDQLHMLVSLLPHQNTNEVVSKFRKRAEEALFARFPTLSEEVSGSVFEAGYEVDTTGERSPLADEDHSLDPSLTGLWLSGTPEESLREEQLEAWETARLPTPPKSASSEQSRATRPTGEGANTSQGDPAATVKMSIPLELDTKGGAPPKNDVPKASPNLPAPEEMATVKMPSIPMELEKEANPFDSDPALTASSSEANPFESIPSFSAIVDEPEEPVREEASPSGEGASGAPAKPPRPAAPSPLPPPAQWAGETLKLRHRPKGNKKSQPQTSQDYGETVRLSALPQHAPQKRPNRLLRVLVLSLLLVPVFLAPVVLFGWPEIAARLGISSAKTSLEVAHSAEKLPLSTPSSSPGEGEGDPKGPKEEGEAVKIRGEVNKIAYGKKLAAQKRFSEAARVLEEAREETPDDPALYRSLGDVYLALGQKEDAVAAWEEFLRLAPKGQEKRRVKALIKAYR